MCTVYMYIFIVSKVKIIYIEICRFNTMWIFIKIKKKFSCLDFFNLLVKDKNVSSFYIKILNTRHEVVFKRRVVDSAKDEKNLQRLGTSILSQKTTLCRYGLVKDLNQAAFTNQPHQSTETIAVPMHYTADWRNFKKI